MASYGSYADVTIPCLRFLCEFVLNKGQRLTFEPSSPNGILLFRMTSQVLKTYGQSHVGRSVVSDKYKEILKPLGICLNIFSRSLSGNYVNFGVFKLYNDPALQDALDICLRMSLSVPLDELMAYSKVSHNFFAMLETLCQYHTSTVAELPSAIFVQILTSLRLGLKALDVSISSQCCVALDHVAAFYFNNQNKRSDAALAIQRHVAENPVTLAEPVAVLLNIIIFEEFQNQWSLSRPLLSLILCNMSYFHELRDQIVSIQPPEKQARVVEAFEKLMAEVQNNLEGRNRDKFTLNLTTFRHDIRSFIAN